MVLRCLLAGVANPLRDLILNIIAVRHAGWPDPSNPVMVPSRNYVEVKVKDCLRCGLAHRTDQVESIGIERHSDCI